MAAPLDLTTRHGFLAALHDLLNPATYLEIGVQHGTSLNLAHRAKVAIGVDPHPLVPPTGNQVILGMTSDDYFRLIASGDDFRAFSGGDGVLHYRRMLRTKPLVDLAFIDGMHLSEYAWRDFLGVESICHPRSVVVFDDVLPRNQHEARRIPVGEPVVGDWTGDVWKVYPCLREMRPGLTCRLVDTRPTGVLVVTGFPDTSSLSPIAPQHWVTGDDEVPDWVLHRTEAIGPFTALQQIRTELETLGE
jgi:hypothetical protein